MYCLKMSNIGLSKTEKIAWILASGIINKNVWLAGGSLRTLIDPKDKICDYDLFFRYDVREHKDEEYFWHVHLENVRQTREKLNKLGFKCTFECPEGKLYTYQKEIINMLTEDMESTFIKVQLICEYFYQTPEELLSTFDLTPCLFATDGEFLWTYKKAIKDVKNKIVELHKLTYPISTLKRIIKYAKKGYRTDYILLDFVTELGNLYKTTDILASDSMRVYID